MCLFGGVPGLRFFGGGPRYQIFLGGAPRSQIFRGRSQVSDFGGVPGLRFSGGVPGLIFLGGGPRSQIFGGGVYLVSVKGKIFDTRFGLIHVQTGKKNFFRGTPPPSKGKNF